MNDQAPPPTGRSGPQAASVASPGVLRGEFKLVLHTRQAQRLFMGRAQAKNNPDKKLEVPGIGRFANRLRQVKVAITNDDPYADWLLVQLDEALETVASEYRETLAGLEQRMKSDRVTVQTAHSVEPVELSLGFDHAYAYAAVHLLADFDELAVTILSANHTAIIGRDERERLMHQAQRRCRFVLQLPQSYRFSGASRSDFASGNQRAQSAIAQYGPVPEDILSKERRPRFSIGQAQATGAGASEEDQETAVEPDELLEAAQALRSDVVAAE